MRRQNPQPEKQYFSPAAASETGRTPPSARKKARQVKRPQPTEWNTPYMDGASKLRRPSEGSSQLTQKSPPKPRPNQNPDFGASPSGTEEAAAGSAKRKRRRLPSLQEVLDAFEPEEEYLDPTPEPGDFWAEPDDEPMD